MLLSSILSFVSGACCALAQTTTTTTAAPAPTTITPVGREYYLKTQVIEHGGPRRFNNLYIEAYHTGAGLNDAVLVPKSNHSAKGSLASSCHSNTTQLRPAISLINSSVEPHSSLPYD